MGRSDLAVGAPELDDPSEQPAGVHFGFYFYAASGLKTRLTQKVRHPQLSGFKAWALAHLLVVGSVQGVILFGGLLAWAVVSVIVINRAKP